jgi:hypothetical protein
MKPFSRDALADRGFIGSKTDESERAKKETKKLNAVAQPASNPLGLYAEY